MIRRRKPLRRVNAGVGADLEREADRLFSARVRARGRCAFCHSRANLDTAHVFNRRARAIRWDDSNALCLCRICHDIGHDNKRLFLERVRAIVGGPEFERLRAAAARYSGKVDVLTEVERLRKLSS